MGYAIGKKISEQLKKIELNEFGDYILINPADASFSEKYSALMAWIDDKSAELGRKAQEMREKYGDTPMISHDEDGNTVVDSEQFSIFVNLKNELYKECVSKIDSLFGDGTIRKYFRAFYEINPDFIPDEDCIMDFLEEIAPILKEIYGERTARINSRYNKERRGGLKTAVMAAKGK